MNKFKLYTAVIASAVMLVSCKPSSSLQKDIKHMDIRFKPLSRTDLTLVGNLQAETTISGKMKQGAKLLDKSFASNLKVGYYRSAKTEMMYFAPAANEVITGSLYENEIFNSIYASSGVAAKPSFLKSLLNKLGGFTSKLKPAPVDHALNFAYFGLIEKYPDVDYFINVRFDRKYVQTGKRWTETVVVKADGIKLKTD
jgi:hypothetical protein